MKVMPKEAGVHHFMISSGLVQASNTIRAGPLKVRVTTTSRSDRRSVVVSHFGMGSLFRSASIGYFLLFEFFNDFVEFIEAGGPELPVALDPRRLLFEPADAQPAGPHPAHLLGDHEP